MASFNFTGIYEDPITGIKWNPTGEILDRVSIYDWEEVVIGHDKDGNIWKASATVSCGIIQEIIEPKLISS